MRQVNGKPRRQSDNNKGKFGGTCFTATCNNPSRWIPVAPYRIRDQGNYYCTECCDEFAKEAIA